MMKTYKILLSFFLILMTGLGFSQSVPSYVPTNGLVGWWPLDINPNNSFGNGLNGSFNGSFVSSGRNCAQFNNSLLVIPGEPVFNISNFTTSYWIKINSHTIHTGIQFGIPNGPLRWAIGWYPSAFLFAQMTCAGGWGQGNYFDNNVNFNTGTWYHLTIVHIGITTKLYINSNLIGTLSTAAPLNCWNSSMNLYIGGDIGGGAIEYFDGYVDDFGFWNRALTQQEITNLYNSQVPQPCTTSVTTSLNINGCGFAVLSNGDTVTQTGNYLDTLSTLGGCDSIINQSVTIQPSSNCNPIPSYVPTNGLVGWWGFNGNAQDGSGNGNHGTVNGATLTTDRFGNQNGAYEFSNTFGRIQSVQLNLSNTFTFLISIKLNNYNQIGTPFEINEGFSCNLNPQIWPNNGNLYLARCGNGMLNPLLIGDINSLIGVWTHLVVVHEGSTTRLYKNGTLMSVINHQWPQTSLVNLTLANDGNTPFNYQSKCTFDDLGIWNRALTQQEITNLYNAQSCQVSITAQPSNQTTGTNRNVQFSVVSSDSNSTYRWQTDMGLGFQNLTNAGQYAGVNTSTLNVSNTSPHNDNQLFRCIVSTTNCGSDTSDAVTLNVNTSSSSTGVPNKFNYQLVVRDTSGQLVTNRPVSMRLSLQRGPQMTNLYTETHQLTTNSNGLLTCIIGSGQPTLGMMDTIDWSGGMVYVKTEIDMSGGSNYSLVSTRELLSVPYALYSLNSGSSTPGPVGPMGPQGLQGNDGPQGVPGPQGPQGSFPAGTQPGEINYWNGTTWVSVPPGMRGQFLAFCDGVPTWGGCLPQVTTSPITNVGAFNPTTGGNVTSDGGSMVSARGVVYGTSSNPTLSNNFTTDGTGTGSFISVLSGLSPVTTYYVRAYATNGVGTSYGNEFDFTTINFMCGTTSIVDLDGNIYNTVQIGTQCWTQSNLKVTKYRNGDNIPTGLSDAQWGSTSSGAYAIYNNDPVNDALYGKLYNWYAVTDSRGLCPTGWHVPSDGEWTTLTTFLGGQSVAGGAMKSTATQPTPGGWYAPNTGATNSSGFTGLPGGLRASGGGFSDLGYTGTWWSSSFGGSIGAWYRILFYGNADATIFYNDPSSGFSVRCARD